MFRINLYPTQGRRLWISEDASPTVRNLSGVWCIGAGSFRIPEKIIPLEGHSDWALASSALENTAYLGFENGRHYFTKGIGSIFSTGWTPGDPVLNRGLAIKYRDGSRELAQQGFSIICPEAIILHRLIPDVSNQPPHPSSTAGQSPWMFVYSTSCRWRLSDLCFLKEVQRQTVFGFSSEYHAWLKRFLQNLAENLNRIVESKTIGFELSMQSVFVDGTLDVSVTDQKTVTLLEIGWTLAEMLRLPVPANEIRRWINH